MVTCHVSRSIYLDFFLIPPHVVHRESNPGGEEQVLVVIRSGSGATVVNVEEPASE